MKSKNKILSLAIIFVFFVSFAGKVFAAQSGDFTYTAIDASTAKITNYTGAGGDVDIPSTLDLYSIVEISAGAFYNKSLTSVTIPNTIRIIGTSAFQNNIGLTDITLPENLTSLGSSVFNGTSISSVEIPASLGSVPSEAFNGLTSLVSVIIPDGITSIGSNAFKNTGLTSIVFPNSLTSIGSEAFSGLTSLVSVIIPDGITSIGSNAFRNTGLTSIVFPNSLTSIGGGSFRNTKLTSVTIPSNITSIGFDAFADISTLTNVIFNEGLTTIDCNAFANTNFKPTTLILPNSLTSVCSGSIDLTNLEDLTVGSNIVSPSLFAGKTTLKKVKIIPIGAKTIADNSFSGDLSIINVNIQDGIVGIGAGSFAQDSSLREINIPSSVTNIGNGAFYGNSNLDKIYFFGNAPTFGGPDVFKNANPNLKVFYVKNKTGFDGAWNIFDTEIMDVPTVVSIPASSVSKTSVILNANITSVNNYLATSRGFEYGLTKSYGETLTEEDDNIDAGPFSANIGGLKCGRLYHFRSYATNIIGVGYSDDETFETQPCKAVVSSFSGSSASSRYNNLISMGKTEEANKLKQEYPNQINPTKETSTTTTPLNITRTLKYKMTGDDVKALQVYLNTHGYIISTTGVGSLGKETKYFGLATKSTIIKFQKANNLTPDGIVGPKTREVMK